MRSAPPRRPFRAGWTLQWQDSTELKHFNWTMISLHPIITHGRPPASPPPQPTPLPQPRSPRRSRSATAAPPRRSTRHPCGASAGAHTPSAASPQTAPARPRTWASTARRAAPTARSPAGPGRARRGLIAGAAGGLSGRSCWQCCLAMLARWRRGERQNGWGYLEGWVAVEALRVGGGRGRVGGGGGLVDKDDNDDDDD